ncbi:MAG TPA: Ig domain-containing protein [Solirubrobacteraceae bacterium]|nr:Ig domain-containing protein [Solirubrobacteraceae bacterium]
MSAGTSRQRAHRRASRPIALLVALVVVASLIGGMAQVAQAAVPTLKAPGNQTSVAGKSITPLVIEGTEIVSLAKEVLPAGLTAKVVDASHVEITGTPKTAGVTEAELIAKNAEGESLPATFKWTVTEPEAPAAITPPPTQRTVIGTPVTLTVHGERMHEPAAVGLPEGLTLEPVSETEFKITGTPTKLEKPTVKLKAKNNEGVETTTTFEWQVVEPSPTITKPADQSGPERVAIAPLPISGANMAPGTLKAEGLPPGLAIEQLASTEGAITGTPTAAGSYTVTLKAMNPEGTPAEASFSWVVGVVIHPPPPTGPTASNTPSISPGVVFSAARATCKGAAWSGGTVTTQWLLDGAPIAGATGATFVPPRSYDGHALACRQTATANGASTTLTSAAKMVHEQPPQPAWPISPASVHCASAICMQQGAGPGAVGQAYPQEGAWWGSQQVRCVSAPWTSAVGSSAQPAVRALAEAHTVQIALQRVSSSGVVTVAAQEVTALGTARDELDGSSTPFGGSIVAPFGAQAFAAGELWSARFPGSVGRPDWFAAGGGLLAYGVASAPGVARSFQLTYTLGAADLGARLRCVAAAQDGPAGAPTSASFASPEYAVASFAACGPKRLGSASLPQPALVWDGEAPCLGAPSSLAGLGASPRDVAVKGGRVAVALGCAARHGCRGTLALTAVVGRRRETLGNAKTHVGAGAVRVIALRLSAPGKHAVSVAGGAGLSASLQLGARRHASRVASVRLVSLG